MVLPYAKFTSRLTKERLAPQLRCGKLQVRAGSRSGGLRYLSLLGSRRERKAGRYIYIDEVEEEKEEKKGGLPLLL